MNYSMGCVLVLLSALGAAGVSYLVWHTLGLDMRRRYHEVGNSVFLQLGVMFAVLLAFVFSQVWSEYNRTAEAINGECGALHGAAMLARGLSAAQGLAVDRAILSYSTTVVNTEWPQLAKRRSSPEAMKDFQAILETVSHLDVSRPVEVSDQGQILSLLTQAHAFRETRTFQASQGVPIFMWVILCFYTFVLILFVLLAAVESPAGHMVFAGVFAGSTVLILVLVRMLDYPFEGALALGNGDFLTMTQRVSTLTTTP
jgi:hypothetical protein